MLLVVEVTDATKIRDTLGQELAFGDLAPGQEVLVTGNLSGDGRVAAGTILVVRLDQHPRGKEGVVTDLDLAAGAFRLVVDPWSEASVPVSLTPETEVLFLAHPLTTNDLTNGQQVRVRGETDASGAGLLAEVINLQPVRFHAFVTETFCPDAMRVHRPRARIRPLELAGITLVPENSAVVRLDGDFGEPTRISRPGGEPISCEEIPLGRAVFVTGRMVPHAPEPGVDENPFQVRAHEVRLVPPAHLTGLVTDALPEEGRFRLKVFADEAFFERPDGTYVEHEVWVRVTPETRFLAPLTGDLGELVGQEVGVLGFFLLGPDLPSPEVRAFGVALLSSLPDGPER